MATLAAIAWGHDHNGFYPIEAAALILALPMVVPALPIIYFVGALAWNATGAPENGLMWPVALTFALMLGVCACANVWLLHVVATRWRMRRDLGVAPFLHKRCDRAG